jgi:putative heme-binding domain-containing protein
LTAAGSLTSAAGSSIPDRVQEHSIIYALIEIDAPSATRQGLESENHFTKRAALIALDQMDNGKLDAKTVAPLLSSADPVLKETANWIVSHRRAWGGDLAEFFAAKLNDKNLSEPEARELERQLATLAAAEPIQELLVKSAADEKLPTANRLVALHAMAQAHPKETPASWTELIARLAGHGEGDLAGPAVAAASSFSFKRLPEDLKTALFTAAHNERLSEETRLQALAVASPGAELDDTLFRFVRENLTSEKSLSIRNSASAILTKAKLNQEQSLALCENIKMAGPLELSHLLGAFENSTSELVGTTLISSLKESRGLSGLHPDRIKQTLAKYPEPVKEQGRAVAAMLDEDLAKQAAHLDALLPRIKGGDIRRGQALFNSQKAACASCHQIGYLGGNLGPDLTRIGQVRTERDLLEAIVYPSASFVRSFEPVIVRTKGGDEYSGVLRKDAVDEVVLGTGPGADVRIARNDVEETRPGKISVMPQGFAEQLRQDELADLIAFLEANR